MEKKHRLLAVDDDIDFLKALKKLLTKFEFDVEVAIDPFKAVEQIKNNSYDCILLDMKMPGLDGIQLMDKIMEEDPLVPVIFISGQSNIPLAVHAMKKGAYDFIEKPIEPERLIMMLKHAIERNAWSKERDMLLTAIDEKYQMIGESPVMKEVFKKIKIFSTADAKVLITGETGTGKELVANILHYNSPRAGKPFIKINCAAIPNELLESELFGHVKGAFTGAVETKKGKFHLAQDGTLFLDEIGDMDIYLQAKLLKILDTGEFSMLGDNKTYKANCRIISATNQNLEELIAEKKFREDLYHRLNVLHIHIPPLRERREDIPHIARFLLSKATDQYNKKILDFSDTAIELLKQFDWPGNVRQLKNVVEKLVIFSSGPIIEEKQIENIFNEPLFLK
ncbi:sigma-54-dependent transcriptional regulator [Caldithrix abyssi]|uniref:Putative two component, sigma54 specific, transcriptional regulator n=1 Tax=Caldithrix abyssi DSM 13497 TaxID=880073 RepID=H1XY99_CALAY|nr:sigma-54 dependent transcriptional regulator [Caldithrix abyssi]APF19257.1 two-component system, NtrC family, response regulator AtoC [Caldithrix abyssi DSM 13497]EHO43166.1 putative two component, sigma54 specific, transcriptional regulator [Caldithrix abyssi DSM 13497]